MANGGDRNAKCPKCGSGFLFDSDTGVKICKNGECSYEWKDEDVQVESSTPEHTMTIFLSYGHDANSPLVNRIGHDLEARGHTVWIDRSEIRSGDDWRRKISDGIKNSNSFVSFLSKHSVRDPGVCLDEIGIAIGEKSGNIRTILVENERDVEAPPGVGHVQWLDMSEWKGGKNGRERCVPPDESSADKWKRYGIVEGDEAWEKWYAEKFSETVRVVESPENVTFNGEMSALKEVLKPLPSDSRINEFAKKEFEGRKWAIERIGKWMENENASKILRLTGKPGSGKSALAAYLSHFGKKDVVAAHFVQFDKDEYRDHCRLIRSIAFQLAARFPEYRGYLVKLLGTEFRDAEEIRKSLDKKKAPEIFEYLLSTPLTHSIDGGHSRCAVVLDALDELKDPEDFLLFFTTNMKRLPKWLRFITTSRPEGDIARVLEGCDTLDLDAAVKESGEDIGLYVKKILKDKLSEYEENESKEILRRIVAAGDGVFLYAEKFCEEVNKGNIRLDDTRNYPDGLSGIYLGYFKRAFPDTEDYESSALPVLRAVLAAKESLPKNVLELVLLEENTDSFEDVEKKTALEAKKCCREALEKLASFLISSKKDGVECFSPYHKTLADWLSDEQRSGKFFADPKFGDVSLADTGMKCFKVLKMGGEHGSRLKKLFEMEELPKYFLIHLAWHLVDTGRYDEATRVLSDLNVFEEMYVYNEYMLGGCWRKVNERTGANPADCYGNAVKEKERDGWGKLNGGDVCNVMGVFF